MYSKFSKIVQRKQSPNSLKLAQSGHPAADITWPHTSTHVDKCILILKGIFFNLKPLLAP
jgi:hypothetical protein